MRALVIAAMSAGVAACTLVSGAADLSVRDETSAARAADASHDDATGSSPADGSSGAALPDGAAPDTGSSSSSSSSGGPACTTKVHGPRTPTAVDGNGWTTPDFAKGQDGRVAHGDSGSGALVAQGFGFAIPDGAEIRGLELTFGRSCSGGLVKDDRLGFTDGAPKTSGAAWFVDDDELTYPKVTFGGPDDLWDAKWTPSDVNGKTFGVAIFVDGPGDGHIDSIEVKVYTCE